MLAIALAVVAQLALGDGLTLLGVAGYIVAAWLFISSVRGIFDSAPEQVPETVAAAEVSPDSSIVTSVPGTDGRGKLSYLRRNWRLVTMAEIFKGDIPPGRLRHMEESALPQTKSGAEPIAKDPLPDRACRKLGGLRVGQVGTQRGQSYAPRRCFGAGHGFRAGAAL
jgi:hypothetical protein